MSCAEEYFCVVYLVVSSLCLLYQLRSQTFVSVECRDVVWVFCLENNQHESSLRYVLNEKDVENRCNSHGTSSFLCFVVFLLTSVELVSFLLVVYLHHCKVKRQDVIINGKLSSLLTNILLAVTGILISLLLVFPLIQYHTLSKTDSTQGGFFNKILYSPPRALISFIISLVTAPLRSIFHDQFTVEFNLDKVYPNFSCVEPVRDRVTNAYRCSMEPSWPANIAEPSPCKATLSCTEDCQVVFPRIIISSLGVILASFALCYQLLRVRHNCAHSTQTFGAQDEEKVHSTTVANEDWTSSSRAKSTKQSNAINRGEMRNRSLSFTKPAASDLEWRTSSGPRKYSNVEGCRSEPKGAKVEDSKRNGREEISNNYTHRQCEEFKQSRSKNGDRRLERSENGLIKRGSRQTNIRNESLEELGSYSTGEEFREAVLVEDESEYYMSGFRL